MYLHNHFLSLALFQIIPSEDPGIFILSRLQHLSPMVSVLSPPEQPITTIINVKC